MNEVNVFCEREAKHLRALRGDLNAGAMFCQQAKPRGAASKNFTTVKFYAEPNPILTANWEKKNESMILYKHTQIGYLMMFITSVMVLFFGFILSQTGFELISFVGMFFILLILVSFLTLKVTVDENHLGIKFGYGIFRKKFLLENINSAKVVKNHWYYGWGMRVWFWPYMWIFNVSGFDAVEIIMKNKKIYRIGTDDPRKLETVIKRVINSY